MHFLFLSPNLRFPPGSHASCFTGPLWLSVRARREPVGVCVNYDVTSSSLSYTVTMFLAFPLAQFGCGLKDMWCNSLPALNFFICFFLTHTHTHRPLSLDSSAVSRSVTPRLNQTLQLDTCYFSSVIKRRRPSHSAPRPSPQFLPVSPYIFIQASRERGGGPHFASARPIWPGLLTQEAEPETLRHVVLLPEGGTASSLLCWACAAAHVYVCVYVCLLTYAYGEDPVGKLGWTGVHHSLLKRIYTEDQTHGAYVDRVSFFSIVLVSVCWRVSCLRRLIMPPVFVCLSFCAVTEPVGSQN